MTYFADESSAAVALNDPATSRADLMSIAYAYPVLGAEVARHPNAYPGLLDWLEQFGTPKARAEVASVRATTPAPVYRPARPAPSVPAETVLVTPPATAAAAAPVAPAPAPAAPAPAPVYATPAPVFATPAPAPVFAAPAPAPAPFSVTPRTGVPTSVPTVPVTPAATRTPLPPQTAAMADAPTGPIPVTTAPLAADVAPAAAAAAAPAAAAHDDAPADTATYVSPFDEYSDETEPAPAAAKKAPAADADADDGDGGKPWSTGKKVGLAAVIVVVVAIAVALGTFFGVVKPNQRALDDAKTSFATASSNFNDAQTALAAQITAAGPVASTASTSLKDPTTLTTLQTALTTAQGLVGVPAAMATTTAAINQQVTDLNNHTTDVNNATQALQTAITAVQQSSIDLAVDNLNVVLKDAQGVSDSASWMSTAKDKPTATMYGNLQTLITQATAATTNPSSLGADTGTIVSALQTMTSDLQTTINNVNDANTKAAGKTYNYVLTGADQVTCGSNVCSNGTAGGDPMTVASVKVTVKGSTVTAQICMMSGDPVDPNTCKSTSGQDGNNGFLPKTWTGTKSTANGVTTAKVISTDKTQAEFLWGTITFDSSAPDAAATNFAAADNCEKSDGSGDGQLVNGSCQ